jgi:hypothetical protein
MSLRADALIQFQDDKTKLVLACGINGDLAKFGPAQETEIYVG